MQNRDKFIVWGLGIFVMALFIYAIKGILLPFIVAFISAYFLNPAVELLHKKGLSRSVVVISITTLFFLLVISSILLLSPVLYRQMLELLHALPQYIIYVNQKIVPSFNIIIDKLGPDAVENARNSIGNISGYMLKFFSVMVGNIWNSGLALVNILSLLFLTPIVTFYILRDWDIIINKIVKLFPVKHSDVIKAQLKEIDKALSGYIRGQTHVCLIMGIFYSIGLTLTGLEYGLFIGMATGILLFIPYVGMLFGCVVGLAVAFFQFGDIFHIGIIASVFVIGQVIEGAFITPNLVGNKIGLHPVWIMFSLLAGGALLGLLGVLIAVPCAAIIAVLVRHFFSSRIV